MSFTVHSVRTPILHQVMNGMVRADEQSLYMWNSWVTKTLTKLSVSPYVVQNDQVVSDYDNT